MNAIIPSSGEHLLADAIRRAQRSGNQQLIVLHLGALAYPRPHHRRIARALLQDAASRHGGQVFPMRNGDLALLTMITDGTGGAIDPANLPATMAELFRAERPNAASLIEGWSVEQNSADIFQYLQSMVHQEPVQHLDEEMPPPPHMVEDIASLLATARIGDLTQRQTAIEITPGDHGPGKPGQARGKIMRPIFREITFSVPVLEGRMAVTGRPSSDPYLFEHLAARLDPSMMDLVIDEISRAEGDAPPLHLNLTIQTVLSPEFLQFAEKCRALNHRPGIEVPLIDVCRAPDQFATARDLVRSFGFPLVIQGVTPLGLRLSNPASFGADFVKLNWERSLIADLHPGTAEAIERLGPGRIILQRAPSEEAVTFGLAHGITKFQGRHIDAMLAASRLESCPQTAQCSLRQCSERAAATSMATRRFCTNLKLLDRGLPA